MSVAHSKAAQGLHWDNLQLHLCFSAGKSGMKCLDEESDSANRDYVLESSSVSLAHLNVTDSESLLALEGTEPPFFGWRRIHLTK